MFPCWYMGKGFLSPGLANPTSVSRLTLVLVSSSQPSAHRDSLNEEMGHTTTVHGTATYTNYFHSPHDCLPSLLPLTIFSLPDESNVLDKEKFSQPVKETWTLCIMEM
jgi:hypothetical protein